MDPFTDGFAELTLETPDLARLEASTSTCSASRCSRARTTASGSRRASTRGSGSGRPGEKEFGDAGGATCTSRSPPRPAGSTRSASGCARTAPRCAGPEEHDGGDRSLYVEDPEGNVVEVWDFFARGQPGRGRSRTEPVAVHGVAAKRVEVEVEGRTLSLSNLDKVFYPETGFTKGELIDYYTRVSPALLPHLRDRALTLKRYPNGVTGQFFYEKQCPGHAPDWVRTAHDPLALERARHRLRASPTTWRRSSGSPTSPTSSCTRRSRAWTTRRRRR